MLPVICQVPTRNCYANTAEWAVRIRFLVGPRREDFFRERAITLQKMGEQKKAEEDLAKANQLKK